MFHIEKSIVVPSSSSKMRWIISMGKVESVAAGFWNMVILDVVFWRWNSTEDILPQSDAQWPDWLAVIESRLLWG